MHMSLRLAWHNNGWDGHICEKPSENTYCIGQHSYPGTLILQNRDLKYEEEHAGESIACQNCNIPCGLSANAFGKENIKVKVDIPDFWFDGADATDVEIPPSTACTWPYEKVYKGDVTTDNNYDNDKRHKNVEEYFSQFEEGKRDTIFNRQIENLDRVRRNYKLMDDDIQELILEILPRFDLNKEQVAAIINDRREEFSITEKIDKIIKNPYILFEQYKGIDEDNIIPFYKIDNGIIVSPEYGLDNLLDVDSPERLRALCVDELNKIPAHSFGKAQTILNSINERLERMPEWKKHSYKMKNFEVDIEILEQALHIREDENNEKYLYLKWVYEDEREIQNIFEDLVNRPDINLKMTISKDKFKRHLRIENSKINELAKDEYEKIIDNQAEICMQLFTKPICVLSGAAGTGKTTVIKAIVENIEQHGQATSFLLMAPTGKASERIKNQTGKTSSTIHSYLANNGWINTNFTLKRYGGKKGTDVNTIIIDECSMIDLNLFATLLRSINWNNVQRLILVGDPNQLPPIGRGKVFHDTIKWLKENYSENVGILKDNIRQLVNQVEGNGCGILDLAELFIQEKQDNFEITNDLTELKNKKEDIIEKILENGNGSIDKDLSVYFWKDQNELNLVLKKALREDMKKITDSKEDKEDNELWKETIKGDDYEYNPDIIQVISPYRGEFYGADAINLFLQSSLNPQSFYPLDGINHFDKVIQIRNRPKSDKAYVYNFETKRVEREEIYNGEIGIAERNDFERKRSRKIKNIQVKFSNKSRRNLKYKYGKAELIGSLYIPEQKISENLELAYAISVHKSQGSEFDYVYIIVPKRQSHLITMELMYTAITRAQKKVVLLLQEDIGTITELTKIEKSAVRKINSSVFEFLPLPEEILYINNHWYESGKNISTISKYFVRSKSEAIITNMLVERQIDFKYEEPLYAPDGTMYLPDFTVIFRGEKYYWEHVGRIDIPSYKEHWKKKEDWYNKHFKGKLIITYEGNNLSIDAENIIKLYK